MESENPAADQLPEAESLPDGFSSTTDPLPPQPHHKEENIIHPQPTNCEKSHPKYMEDCKYISLLFHTDITICVYSYIICYCNVTWKH